MEIKQKDLIAVYDECDIIENDFQARKEDESHEGLTDEEIYESVHMDQELFEREYEYFKKSLTEVLNEINRNGEFMFKAKGLNMGWRNLEGTKEFKAENGKELIESIFPNTNEWTARVYKKGKYQIVIKVSHHDSPMGEYYIIKPMSKKEILEFEEY